MEMTELQIASEYRTGKDKSKTIKVLAELNLVTQRQIAEILQAQGEELPKHWKEKLAVPLKRPPHGKPATQREINDAVLKAAMGAKAEEFRRQLSQRRKTRGLQLVVGWWPLPEEEGET